MLTLYFDAPPPPPLPPPLHSHQEGKLPKDKRNRLWALGKPERGFLYLSLTATAFSGAMFPVFSLMLSTIITFFYLDDPDELERKVGVVISAVQKKKKEEKKSVKTDGKNTSLVATDMIHRCAVDSVVAVVVVFFDTGVLSLEFRVFLFLLELHVHSTPS